MFVAFSGCLSQFATGNDQKPTTNGEVRVQNGDVATAAVEKSETGDTAANSGERPGRKKLSRQSTSVGTTPLPPSTRLSALGIVSDLLRKVGMLETKLSNARSLQSQQATNQIFSPIQEANR